MIYDATNEQASLIAEAKRLNPGVHWETLFNFLRTNYRLYFQADDHDVFVVAHNMGIPAATSPLTLCDLIGLNPNTVVHGSGAFNILAIGKAFFKGANIIFDGNVMNPTTFVDSDSLVGSVNAPWLSTARTVQVWVRNADGQNSDALSFIIT